MADKVKPVKRPGMMTRHPFNVTPRPSKRGRGAWWRKYKVSAKLPEVKQAEAA